MCELEGHCCPICHKVLRRCHRCPTWPACNVLWVLSDDVAHARYETPCTDCRSRYGNGVSKRVRDSFAVGQTTNALFTARMTEVRDGTRPPGDPNSSYLDPQPGESWVVYVAMLSFVKLDRNQIWERFNKFAPRQPSAEERARAQEQAQAARPKPAPYRAPYYTGTVLGYYDLPIAQQQPAQAGPSRQPQAVPQQLRAQEQARAASPRPDTRREAEDLGSYPRAGDHFETYHRRVRSSLEYGTIVKRAYDRQLPYTPGLPREMWREYNPPLEPAPGPPRR